MGRLFDDLMEGAEALEQYLQLRQNHPANYGIRKA
ncbi:Uncharacterised protein [Actinobacillus lignieresii]|uniref:Uncharacterized protein n=1 Tax=Actinobacillus lignieresii TaxID=720 RepID=A0A380U1T8_ACTLI|nr:Uncharacterised protein [Actinobacillus lignieresii]